MVKLQRRFTPLVLNPKKVKELTDEFKKEGKNVWNFRELKEALLELSNGKCAYCECSLNEESKYMEVEHFEDKDSHPDKVLRWNNLLPACKRCNGSKGTHDVNITAIINPFKIEPSDHLKIRLYRLRKKSNLGDDTISVLDLNNTERLVKKRFEIGNAIQDSLEDAWRKLQSYKRNKSTRSKNILLGHVEGLLAECQADSSYAATSASVLHSEEVYKKIKDEMESIGLWPDYLDDLDCQSKKITLQIS